MATNETPKYDILITSISKMYGSAADTREKLKQFILSEFVKNNFIFKYGRLHSVRMPYAQEVKQQHYFGFLTMINPDVHDKLLAELQEKQWVFGESKLKFDKSATLRVPYVKQLEEDTSSDEAEEMPMKRKSRDGEENLVKMVKQELMDDDIEVIEFEEKGKKVKLDNVGSTMEKILEKERELEEKQYQLSGQKIHIIKLFEKSRERWSK